MVMFGRVGLCRIRWGVWSGGWVGWVLWVRIG